MEQKFTRDMIFGSKTIKENIEIDAIEDVEFSLNNITDEILVLKNNIALNIIEIGKKLNTVKENIEYGEFCNWIEDKVQFSQRTANNFMKIAKEFSNSQHVSNLGTRKLMLLAGIENEIREEIIEENNLESITSNELKEIINNKKGVETKPKFTGKIKKDTLKKYKDKFNTNEDFDSLINKLLEDYFKE